jgi:hypothetical protein
MHAFELTNSVVALALTEEFKARSISQIEVAALTWAYVALIRWRRRTAIRLLQIFDVGGSPIEYVDQQAGTRWLLRWQSQDLYVHARTLKREAVLYKSLIWGSVESRLLIRL